MHVVIVDTYIPVLYSIFILICSNKRSNKGQFTLWNSTYGTARFKLDRKLRVVMRAHAMLVISLAFSSASTRKFTCTKNTRG